MFYFKNNYSVLSLFHFIFFSVSGNLLHSIHVQFVSEKRLKIPILSYIYTCDNNSSCIICLLKFCFIIVSAMRDKQYNSRWFEVIMWISIFLRQNGIMYLRLGRFVIQKVTKKYDDVIFEGSMIQVQGLNICNRTYNKTRNNGNSCTKKLYCRSISSEIH